MAVLPGHDVRCGKSATIHRGREGAGAAICPLCDVFTEGVERRHHRGMAGFKQGAILGMGEDERPVLADAAQHNATRVEGLDVSPFQILEHGRPIRRKSRPGGTLAYAVVAEICPDRAGAQGRDADVLVFQFRAQAPR